jgi:ABC-type lipoprotein export system ATPase subunit
VNDQLSTLSVADIYKDFCQGGKVQVVLRGISMTIAQNHSYAITGVSGSGKSTLLHLLGGLDVPSQGSVLFNGKKWTSFKQGEKNAILNKSIGFVFQFHYLIKELSVIENIMLPGLIAGYNRRACRQRAQQLLDIMSIKDKESLYPITLSGGEQQRVAVARALFNKPTFLLADEPTGNLDADNAQSVMDLFLKAKAEWGMSIVLCSHDPAMYQQMETIYHLQDGVIVSSN